MEGGNLKMNISLHNCESFFLDYYEKNLSPVEVAEVLFFLEENPEMKELFESYEAISLEHEKVNFPDKESLKKKYSREELDVILDSEINRTNCELFFVASAEEMLSDAQTRRLYSFLAENPELKKDFSLFQKLKLSADKITFEHKALLKKATINAENREEYFARAIEKDLNTGEEKQLALFLQKNPGYGKELELFVQTILPAEKIVFENKAALKKRERKPVFVSIFSQRSTYYAAAAAILLLAGLFFFFRNDNSNSKYLANTKTATAKAEQENIVPVKKEQSALPQEKLPESNSSAQITISKNRSAVIKSIIPQPEVREEKIVPQPVLPEIKSEDPMLAKQEEKKSEEPKMEAPATAKNESKKDSASITPVPDPSQALASAVNTKSAKDEYQTFGSIINKKVRSVLGIKKAECETSDRITVWDLAMVAKQGVQRIIGVKTLDVNKICDGTNNKVEYVFASGNFEISKSTAR